MANFSAQHTTHNNTAMGHTQHNQSTVGCHGTAIGGPTWLITLLPFVHT